MACRITSQGSPLTILNPFEAKYSLYLIPILIPKSVASLVPMIATQGLPESNLMSPINLGLMENLIFDLIKLGSSHLEMKPS
jgi:hypothetical protein